MLTRSKSGTSATSSVDSGIADMTPAATSAKGGTKRKAEEQEQDQGGARPKTRPRLTNIMDGIKKETLPAKVADSPPKKLAAKISSSAAASTIRPASFKVPAASAAVPALKKPALSSSAFFKVPSPSAALSLKKPPPAAAASTASATACIGASEAKLKEVERSLAEKRSADRKSRALLEEKMGELERMKKSSLRNREKLERVKGQVAVEKAKMTARKTLAEYERQQALLRKMKRQAGDVDVAFLLDCTCSMRDYIEEAKDKIRKIVGKVIEMYSGRVSVAFVGYRDHHDEDNRIVSMDFGAAEEFESFLTGVETKWGKDICEDVHGGLEAVLDLSWSKQNRCLIHIADAPAHGSRFHDFSADEDFYDEYGYDRYDDYSDYNDKDPRGLVIEDLLDRIKQMKIYYTFGWINSSTYLMIQEFKRIGGRNFVRSCDMRKVENLLKMSVETISLTIQNNWKRGITGGGATSASRQLSFSSRVSSSALKSFAIVEEEPDWNKIPWKRVRIGRGEVTEKDGKIIVGYKYSEARVKMSKDPFAEGGMRLAYFGIEVGLCRLSTLPSFEVAEGAKNKVVFKTFKHVDERTSGDGREDFLSFVEIQAISKHLAKEFNKMKPSEAKAVDFLDVKLIEVTNEDGSLTYYTMEDILPDYSFTKYSSNFGFVNKSDSAPTLDAFSHWTYEHTSKYLIVVDLQGTLRNADQYLLTDPAIHCPEQRFGSTNLGEVGVETFFEGHECNRVCQHLGLRPNRHMKNSKVNLGSTSFHGKG